jgi:uncharacterized membrane protein HdeD (DUF308 family)
MATVESTRYPPNQLRQASAKWWVLLLTGIAWIIVSVLVLDADLDSARIIGFVVGGFLIVVGVLELALLGADEGWKWLHAALGVILVLGGIAAFLEPFRTYATLASLLGFLLVVKGSFDFATALAARHTEDLWWLVLVAGILQILLGFWAAGYPGRSAELLILWVGIGALIRGITQLVLAFQIREIHEAVS